MKSRWKLRQAYFKGLEIYKFSLNSVELSLMVDELGYFEIEGIAPEGFYAFAQFISSPLRSNSTAG